MTLTKPGATAVDLRSFVLRLTALIAVLGIPILGTSYVMVSHISADIRVAAFERAELDAFAHVIEIVPLIEAVHRDRSDGRGAAERIDRRAVSAAFTAAQNVYAKAAILPHARAVWARWSGAWVQLHSRESLTDIDAVLDTLGEISNQLDDNSPLDVDPNFSVQNLVASMLRQTPRSIVAIRHTADAISAARGPQLLRREIQDIATRRAFEAAPLGRVFADIPFVISSEPPLATQIGPPTDTARARSRAFEADVDRVLTSFTLAPGDQRKIEALARQAIDAHIAMWRSIRVASDGLVRQRYATAVFRRRESIALSILAVALGTLAVALIGRSMLRRDRLALVSAKLESENLRAELAKLSMQRALRLQEAQFRSVFENAELGIVIYNHDATIEQRNAAVSAMLGDRADAILAGRQAQIATFDTVRESFTREEYHTHHDGRPQWLVLTFSGVYDNDVCELVIVLVRDATEEKLLHQELAHAAGHDALTQIANRATFERELHVQSTSSSPFALMYIDLDYFKSVNDTHGHAAGDAVLVATAERLRSALASSDLCCRLGGDEFAAIVRGCDDPSTLQSIAGRIVTSLQAPIVFGDLHILVTASIGVAIGSLDRSIEELKADADHALYEVKAHGRNGYRILTRAHGEPLRAR